MPCAWKRAALEGANVVVRGGFPIRCRRGSIAPSAVATGERARERGCHLIQRTTDKQRRDATRLDESLGFVASHEGMKLKL